jgi:hypothetical protein
MKLRILDHSIRLRLKRSEVAALVSKGIVECSTRFGPGACFHYQIVLDASEEHVSASFADNVMRVAVSPQQAAWWARSETVAMRSEAGDDEGGPKVLIEKDFPCAHHADDAPEDKFLPSCLSVGQV